MTTDPVTTDPVTTVRGQRELKRYLTLATWGLWGTKRQEVRAELEEHVLERADGLMAFGVPPHEALQRALRELGPPERVCAEMNGVYLMPRIIKLAALSALLVTLGMRSLTISNASVNVTYNGPNKFCPSCAPIHPEEKNDAWVNIAALEKTLEAQGVGIKRTKNSTTFSFQGTQQFSWTVPLSDWFAQRHKRYTPTYALLSGLIHADPPAFLSGFNNPSVQIQHIKFQLGSSSDPLSGWVAYRDLCFSIAFDISRDLFPFSKHSVAGDAGRVGDGRTLSPLMRSHTLKMNLQAGTVMMLVTRSPKGFIVFDFAPVENDGRIHLYTWQPSLTFVNHENQLTPYLKRGKGQAMLLSLTGKLNNKTKRYNVINPDNINYAAQ